MVLLMARQVLLLLVAAFAAVWQCHASAHEDITTTAVHSDAQDRPLVRNADVQVVLFGAYGNLSRKYLWQALFELWDSLHPGKLSIFGVASAPEAIGLNHIEDIIAKNITCDAGTSQSDCDRLKGQFRQGVSYFSNSNSAGYLHLVSVLNASTVRVDSRVVSRLLYFAVAPQYMGGIIQKLKNEGGLNFNTEEGAWGFPTNVILEKPIGSDVSSARQLMHGVTAIVPHGHTFIMDHFLGKAGLQMAVHLQLAMLQDAGHWVKLHFGIGMTQVVMLEDETVEGRTAFYNDYGVVRDVMQNHLTLFWLASDITKSDGWSPNARAAGMQTLKPLSATGVRVGTEQEAQYEAAPFDLPPPWEQSIHRFGAYSGYADTVRAEYMNRTVSSVSLRADGHPDLMEFSQKHGRHPTASEIHADAFVAPTAAQVVFGKKQSFVSFVAGKAMKERTAFVRQFWEMSSPSPCGPMTVTYHMQGKVIMPLGINTSASANFSLPEHTPMVMFTGLCGENAFSPANLFAVNMGWPFAMEVRHFPEIGIFIAVPIIPAWKSRIIHGEPETASVQPDADDWSVDTPIDFEPSKETIVSARVATHRLKALARVPGKSSAAAYRMLLAAGLIGDENMFVSPKEVVAMWDMWSMMSMYGDLAMNTQIMLPPPPPGSPRRSQPSVGITYAIGDSSWLDLLEPSKPTSAQEIIHRPDNKFGAASAFVRDLEQVMWKAMEKAPMINWGVDAGPELVPILDRLAAPDALTMGPWASMHVWLAHEKTTIPNDPACSVCAMVGAFMPRIRIPEPHLHAGVHPNVSHINKLAKEILQGQLDALTLRISNETIDQLARGVPVYPSVNDADADSFGTEDTVYVSDGTGIQEAKKQEIDYNRFLAERQQNESLQLREPEPPAPPPEIPMESPQQDQAPEGQEPPPEYVDRFPYPTWVPPDFNNVPPPPAPYHGPVHTRLSKSSIRSASHVSIVMQESVYRKLVPDAGSINLQADGSLAVQQPVTLANAIDAVMMGIQRPVKIYVFPEIELRAPTESQQPKGPQPPHSGSARREPPRGAPPRLF